MSIAELEPAADFLDIVGLDKTYQTREGENVRALVDINMNVKSGEFITVVGPSGCGKSTLLKILAGTLSRTSGSVKLRGKELNGPSKDLGVVFQAPVLLPWRTVLQNVLIPAQIQGTDPAASASRALSLLDTAGLKGFANKYPHELSGGMQQRAAICRALVHDPSFLLMDEPFGALDAMTRETMNAELLRIWAESRKTIMLITHSIPEAVYLADRVFVMTPRPGRLVDIIDIDLPRPRILEMHNTPHFGRLVQSIRRHFNTQGGIYE